MHNFTINSFTASDLTYAARSPGLPCLAGRRPFRGEGLERRSFGWRETEDKFGAVVLPSAQVRRSRRLHQCRQSRCREAVVPVYQDTRYHVSYWEGEGKGSRNFGFR